MAQLGDASLTYIRSDHRKTGSHASAVSATTGSIQGLVENHHTQIGRDQGGFPEEEMHADTSIIHR